MKYIDTEKLIAEIERMREINRTALMANHITADVFHGRTQAINHLFKLITSLQHEQVEADIEKEIDLFVNGWNIDEFLGLVNDEGWSVTVGDIKNVARHFYKLGLCKN